MWVNVSQHELKLKTGIFVHRYCLWSTSYIQTSNKKFLFFYPISDKNTEFNSVFKMKQATADKRLKPDTYAAKDTIKSYTKCEGL